MVVTHRGLSVRAGGPVERVGVAAGVGGEHGGLRQGLCAFGKRAVALGHVGLDQLKRPAAITGVPTHPRPLGRRTHGSTLVAGATLPADDLAKHRSDLIPLTQAREGESLLQHGFEQLRLRAMAFAPRQGAVGVDQGTGRITAFTGKCRCAQREAHHLARLGGADRVLHQLGGVVAAGAPGVEHCGVPAAQLAGRRALAQRVRHQGIGKLHPHRTRGRQLHEEPGYDQPVQDRGAPLPGTPGQSHQVRRLEHAANHGRPACDVQVGGVDGVHGGLERTDQGRWDL